MFGIKEKFLEWRERLFLKRHHCKNRKEYERNYDPDVNKYAHTVEDFYQGYTYCKIFHSPGDYPWSQFTHWSEGLKEVADWCADNLSGKSRCDIHRVIRQNGLGLDGSIEDKWYFNDVGGTDILFFAFKEEKDYVLFVLRWA